MTTEEILALLRREHDRHATYARECRMTAARLRLSDAGVVQAAILAEERAAAVRMILDEVAAS